MARSLLLQKASESKHRSMVLTNEETMMGSTDQAYKNQCIGASVELGKILRKGIGQRTDSGRGGDADRSKNGSLDVMVADNPNELSGRKEVV